SLQISISGRRLSLGELVSALLVSALLVSVPGEIVMRPGSRRRRRENCGAAPDVALTRGHPRPAFGGDNEFANRASHPPPRHRGQGIGANTSWPSHHGAAPGSDICSPCDI